MAVTVGSLDVLLQLVGGQQILDELNQIRAQVDSFASKPIVLNFGTGQNTAVAGIQEVTTAIKEEAVAADTSTKATTDSFGKVAAAAMQLYAILKVATNEQVAQTQAASAERIKAETTAATETQVAWTKAYANIAVLRQQQQQQDADIAAQEVANAEKVAAAYQAAVAQHEAIQKDMLVNRFSPLQAGEPMQGTAAGEIFGVTTAKDLNDPESLKALNNIITSGGTADQATAKLGSMWQMMRLGRTEMFAFGAAASLAFDAIDQGAAKAASSSKNLTDVLNIGRLAMNAGMAGLMGGMMSGGLALPIGLATAGVVGLGGLMGMQAEQKQQQVDAEKAAAAALNQPFQDLIKAIQAIAPPKDAVTTGLAKTLGITDESADLINKAAHANSAYNDSLTNVIQTANNAATVQKAIADAPQKTLQAEQPSIFDGLNFLRSSQVQALNAEANQISTVNSLSGALDELSVKTAYEAAQAQIAANAIAEQAYKTQLYVQNIGDTRAQAIADNRGILSTGAVSQADAIVAQFQSGSISIQDAITKVTNVFGLSVQQLIAYINALNAANASIPSPLDAEQMRSQALDAYAQRVLPFTTKAESDASTKFNNDVVAAGKQFAADAKAAAEKLQSAFEGIVKNALSVNDNVTSTDQKRSDLATKLAKEQGQLDNLEGHPKRKRELESKISDTQTELDKLGARPDAPDEFYRRLLAVISGTDPSKYAGFSDQLATAQKAMPGSTLQQIADAFKSGALFANMSADDMKKMWNMDAFGQSIHDQIQAQFGTFRLDKVMTADALKNMSASDRAEFLRAQGISSGANLDSVAAFLGAKQAGLNDGSTSALQAAGLAAPISAQVDPKAAKAVKDFADDLDRIKSDQNINVSVNFDKGAWAAATTAILDAEKFIQQHLTKYANILIQITSSYTDTSGGGGSGADQNGGASGNGDTTGSGNKRAVGGYVGNEVYSVGEGGYEYVFPHELTIWLESILGGKITSPDQIKWLIASLAGGQDKLLKDSADWAKKILGHKVDLPENSSDWASHINVLTNGKDEQTYFDWWDAQQKADEARESAKQKQKEGDAAAATASKSSSSASKSGGSGSGNFDATGLEDVLTKLINAINNLTNTLNGSGMLRGVQHIISGNTTSIPYGNVASAGHGFNYGGGGGGNMHLHGDMHIYAPNGATFESIKAGIRRDLGRRAVNYAAQGMD